jgi:3-oxoacyl-[acyl-carrier protein] reductase
LDLGLKGKVALVTGGSRGLGRAICEAFAAEGAHVVVNYRRSNPEAFTAELTKRFGSKALAVAGDVSDEAAVKQVLAAAEEAFGGIDILVNNAGVWPTAFVKEMSLADWNSTIAVNLTGPFLMNRAAIQRWLAQQRRGRIVNVTSQAAYHGSTTGHAHYAAAKAGLANLTISLAREMAPHGIAVNNVAPGFMDTDMAREAFEANRERYLERIPLRRMGEPAEVAAAVVFLASERASYITGATLHVNGGMEMR